MLPFLVIKQFLESPSVENFSINLKVNLLLSKRNYCISKKRSKKIPGNSSLTFCILIFLTPLRLSFYCLEVSQKFVLSFLAKSEATRQKTTMRKPLCTIIKLTNSGSSMTDLKALRVSDKGDKNLSTLLRKFYFPFLFCYEKDKYRNLNAKGNKNV